MDISLAMHTGARHVEAARRDRINQLDRLAGQAAALWRRCLTAYRAFRRTRALTNELQALDDRALHDLGLSRSEVGSMVAELMGRAERTRIQSHGI